MAKELTKEVSGSVYLYEETSHTPSKEIMQFLSVLYAKGYSKVLCVYAAHPKTYRTSIPISPLFDYIWLTSRASAKDETTLNPESEEKFIYDIQEYLSENNPCAILIGISRFIPTAPSGKEPKKKKLLPEWKSYYAQKNKLLKMLRWILDDISESESTCIFTMGKGTIDKSFLLILQRETALFYDKEKNKGVYSTQKIGEQYKEFLETRDMQTIIDAIDFEEYNPKIISVVLKTTSPLSAFKLILKSKDPKKLIAVICKSDCPIVAFAKYAVRSSPTKEFIKLFVKDEDWKKLRSKMKKSENPTEELYNYLRNKER